MKWVLFNHSGFTVDKYISLDELNEYRRYYLTSLNWEKKVNWL